LAGAGDVADGKSNGKDCRDDRAAAADLKAAGEPGAGPATAARIGFSVSIPRAIRERVAAKKAMITSKIATAAATVGRGCPEKRAKECSNRYLK
jgi:hypothetical protein